MQLCRTSRVPGVAFGHTGTVSLGGAMSTPKKTKSSKAERASFEKVITALEKENEAFVIPRAQSKNCMHLYFVEDQQINQCLHLTETVFYVASLIAATAPLILFWGGGSFKSNNWSAVYEGKVHENIIWYLVCVVLSAVLLSHSYMALASRTRKQLLLARYGSRACQQLKYLEYSDWVSL